ncbi:MAG: GNAT family N-acetyltransferase [Melioribacteraceae bacterium]|nr:GNAT family N-acetyltransferase [Melioribacteraceae bacterium]MCF8265988.1 GNAT family N-acetyltransferase [Melioribacteraceae bacterium]MCF8430796.1 GNAT family N-acetyltransferase [Melioribacteraceae bacterium]
MNFIKTNNTEVITQLRSELYQKLTAPIDAMWEQLYIASSQHYLIEIDHKTIGYCCVNSEKCLLQLFLLEKFNSKMEHVITTLIDSELITSARLSSSEPISFNTCLSLSKTVKTNTFCFEHTNTKLDFDPTLQLELLTSDDIPAVKSFLKEQVGMDDTFGYTENLVSRKEIFIVKEADIIIATSECRISDSQPEIADLGIIVNRDFQGKGIATKVLQMQVNRVLEVNRKPICSTTLENVAARKAIEKSGFYCTNIIFDMRFYVNK